MAWCCLIDFYQPDFSIEDLDVHPQQRLSDSSELLLRLRWLAIVSPQVHLSLAASGGIQPSGDLIKALLAGAHVGQVVSCVLRHGPAAVPMLIDGLRAWMREHEY